MSTVSIIMSFSSDSVLAQIRFKITIRIIPQCQNGIDDDGDGLIDYPADTDCTSSFDTPEGAPFVPPTVVCFAPITQGTTSQSMSWIAIPSNGNGTYTYSWSGTDALSGTTSSIDRVYSSVGTKTASLIVTSGGVASAATPCINSILITNPPPPGGGGGGGGSVIIPPKPPVVPPVIPEDDGAPPLDSAPPGGDEICRNVEYTDCPIPSPQSPFSDFKDYLVCAKYITKRITEQEYNYLQPTARKELLGVAVESSLRDRSVQICEGLHTLSSQVAQTNISDTEPSRPFHFFDVGLEGQPAWIAQTVQKGVILGLISTENTLFRPDDNVTRAEAFAMMLKSVCMNPDESVYPRWEERVYETARRYNVTIRSWQDFEPQRPILRQEIFVIATKLDVWRDATGGCTPRHPPKPFPPFLQGMVPFVDLSSAPSEIQSKQQPGTFAFLYENETEKVYTYIVKSGGLPDGVRAQYLRVFGGTKNTALGLSIHDISGLEYAEDRWFLAGELVYVTLKK